MGNGADYTVDGTAYIFASVCWDVMVGAHAAAVSAVTSMQPAAQSPFSFAYYFALKLVRVFLFFFNDHLVESAAPRRAVEVI